jgi:DNA-binding transcriptional LysR family regulator
VDLLAQMRTFVRVVDGKSLSAAARAQRLSLPAISRQLSALEAELGASLIVRSTRKLHVTDAGRQWYEHCVRLLRELDDARAAVRGPDAVSGSLIVSVSLTFGTSLVVPRLRKLVEKYPKLAIDLRLEDQLVDLVTEGVDVAIRAGSPPPDSTAFVAHPIMSMERILVAAPRWLRKHGTPRRLEQLARNDALVQVTPAGNVVRWLLRRRGIGDATSIDIRGHLRANAPVALRMLALDGLGVAFLPDWLVEEDIAQGRLRRVLPEWSSGPITAWAVHRIELRGSPRIRALLDVLANDQ